MRSLYTDGESVALFWKRAKGQANVRGKKKFKVLSHFVLFLRAKAFLPGFYRYCIAEHQTHAPKDRTDENTKVKKSGGELPRKISCF